MTIRHYEGIGAVLADLDSPRPRDSNDCSETDPTSAGWDLWTAYPQARNMLAHGWPDGSRQALELADTLRGSEGTHREWIRSVAGGCPDVPLYLAGEPACMLRQEDTPGPGDQFVHLYIPVSFPQQIKAQAAALRGAAYVALIDVLEESGFRTAITLGSFVHIGASIYGITIDVKAFSDPLSVTDLMFTVGHPAFCRRIIFALRERATCPVMRQYTHISYGRTLNAPTEHLPTDCLPFPALTSDANTWTAAQHLAWLTRQLPESVRATLGA